MYDKYFPLSVGRGFFISAGNGENGNSRQSFKGLNTR